MALDMFHEDESTKRPKQHRHVRNNRRAGHYEFTARWAVGVTEPLKFRCFADSRGLKLNEFTGFRATIISHKPPGDPSRADPKARGHSIWLGNGP